MDSSLRICLFISCLAVVHSQYVFLEGTDTTVKKQRTVVKNTTKISDIILKCSTNIPDAGNKYIRGDFGINWVKEQSSTNCSLMLNAGNQLADNLDKEIKDHLQYDQGIQGDMFWSQITVKDARPEESGKYTCQLLLKGQTTPAVQLLYQIGVLDMTAFEVFIAASDNPMLIPSMPNADNLTRVTQISLGEKVSVPGMQQQYSYLACVARGVAKEAVITMTISKLNYSRSIHAAMSPIVTISSRSGMIPCANKLTVTKILEHRQFPVLATDDGAIVKCTAIIEDENNDQLKKIDTTASMNLMTKPSFINCSQEIYTPISSNEFTVEMKLKAKPQLTGEIQVKLDDKIIFSGPNFKITQLAQEGQNMYTIKLVIGGQYKSYNSVYRVTATNMLGASECSFMLKEGADLGSRASSASSLSVELSVGLCAALITALIRFSL